MLPLMVAALWGAATVITGCSAEQKQGAKFDAASREKFRGGHITEEQMAQVNQKLAERSKQNPNAMGISGPQGPVGGSPKKP